MYEGIDNWFIHQELLPAKASLSILNNMKCQINFAEINFRLIKHLDLKSSRAFIEYYQRLTSISVFKLQLGYVTSIMILLSSNLK
jgi:hypothetical protein